MPAETVRVLNEAFQQALQDPKHLELLKTIQQTHWLAGPDEYKAYAAKAFEDERRLLETAGLLNVK